MSLSPSPSTQASPSCVAQPPSSPAAIRSRAPTRTSLKGRGSTFNPRNRFQTDYFEACSEDLEARHHASARARAADDSWHDEGLAPLRTTSLKTTSLQTTYLKTTYLKTTYLKDASRGVIARNNSPDIPFNASVNPYRGCEHGCVYCYARPTHEYLGFSAGVNLKSDFESRILVKLDAPEFLRAELLRKGWRPQVIAMSGVTDPYQPIERRLGLTRRVLRVLADFRNPVGLITKSALVTRDIDVLRELAEDRCVSVAISVTTLNAQLARILEPRAAGPGHRLRAIHALAEAGIPVGVMVAPVIPGLTDEEIPAILAAAAEAGAAFAGHAMLRLPHAVKDIFAAWLDLHMPDRKEKVLSRLRDLRGGGLDDARFGSRMRGSGAYAQHIADLFCLSRHRVGIAEDGPKLATDAFRVPALLKDQGQLALF